jgi:Amidase
VVRVVKFQRASRRDSSGNEIEQSLIWINVRPHGLTAVFRRYWAVNGACVSPSGRFSTRPGSKVLAGAPPTATDAPMVQRIRGAGGGIVAKTNMANFAFGTFGASPHYGTPGNPADRSRKPGGSSSGAAVAVAEASAVGISTPTQGLIVTAAARLSSSCRSVRRRSEIRAAGTCPAWWYFPAAPAPRCF